MSKLFQLSVAAVLLLGISPGHSGAMQSPCEALEAIYNATGNATTGGNSTSGHNATIPMPTRSRLPSPTPTTADAPERRGLAIAMTAVTLATVTAGVLT
ncbi:hypothetical protein ATCC90586_003318 [Pythium insidiosum]|nr:hypothetical protein ATCC90586_003318 [Pythium insidiosum]